MFRQALTDIIQRLAEVKAGGLLQHYALVGGFAVSAWGVPRATRDIDFAVALGETDPVALATRLGACYRPAEPDDPLRGVFHIDIKVAQQTVPVQLIVVPPTWTQVIFGGVETLSVLECPVPIISWQALVLLKVYAGGPVDLQDARELLTLHQPDSTDLKQLAESIGLLTELETLLRSVS